MAPNRAAFTKVVTTDTSTTSLVVGGANGVSTTGTGGIVAGNAALNKASDPAVAPLTLRGGGSAGAYTLVNSGIVLKDAAGGEVWRLWGTDPDDANFNTGNSYFGFEAGLTQPTNNVDAGFYNTGIGMRVLHAITTGSSNSCFGVDSGYGLTTGEDQVLLGVGAGFELTTQTGNVLVGVNAGCAITTGDDNTAGGRDVLLRLVNGFENTALGIGALSGLSTATESSQNVALGSNAAASFANTPSQLTVANHGIFIGAEARPKLNTSLDEIVIGFDAVGHGDSTATVGSTLGTGASTPPYTHLYAPPSLVLKYNTANLLTIAVSSAGAVTLNADGASAGFTFSDPVTASSTLSASSTVTLDDHVTLATTKKLFFGAGADTWIGETTANQINLEAGGSGGVFLASGGTSWTGVSDERLKTDLAPIADAMGRLRTVRTVMGRFRDDASGKRRPFLIAQDWQGILPSVVDVAENGTLGLRYTDTLPLVIAAIKELDQRVRLLEGDLRG